ncbi:golgin candidate 6-like [Pyrus ussuriensis x Pyrus communis]|uniref:Golgin candidate 6-like n=1 Tax=Pyrus ussuriensis x Pyrus communis TaxID=2448454 RepID=A0A5N5GTA3_9ROSA|nr:golgin candidate 6-like [Pyrus ussuriensis x Pyrus communis]
MATTEKAKEEKEGSNLLGSPTFRELENGRFQCVETGHELLAKDKEIYSQSKRCRLGLIEYALAHKKAPLNMFKQDPLSRSKLLCKLTGDTINKSEEHIWKHINGKRFLNKLGLYIALQCIGNLIAGHPKNLDALASKFLGEGPQEPALNSILRIILRTSSIQEFVAADYVFKSFCENNADGQTMLASTLIPQPHSMIHAPVEEDVNMSFGSMLLQGLNFSEKDGDLETCCRAASVLSHVMKDNLQCKERVLRIELEAPTPSLGAPEPLMHRVVKYLAVASSMQNKDGKSSGNSYVQPVILKLLVTWLADCPSAVNCFLDSRPHITYLLELVSNSIATVYIKGLAAVLLGECVIYNKSVESEKDAFTIVDSISQKVGLTSYFLKFDEMQKSFLFTSSKSAEPRKELTRSASASMVDVDESDLSDQKTEYHPVLSSIFDAPFLNLVKSLEANIREKIVEVYSQPKSKVAVVPAELEQKSGESDGEHIKRLKAFVEKQCLEIQDLLGRNASLAEHVATIGGGSSRSEQSAGSDRVQVETLKRDFQEASKRLELLKAEKAKLESEASLYKNLAGKMESDLKSLSDAYNSLEQANFHLEKEVRAKNGGGGSSSIPDVDAIRAEAREEAQKESEAELNDLLVCLGQEQSKVEKLSARERVEREVASVVRTLGEQERKKVDRKKKADAEAAKLMEMEGSEKKADTEAAKLMEMESYEKKMTSETSSSSIRV